MCLKFYENLSSNHKVSAGNGFVVIVTQTFILVTENSQCVYVLVFIIDLLFGKRGLRIFL